MKTERKPTKTSLKILNVATVEFAEKGYSGARVDEIVGKAGVNKNLLYYYFGSKEDLYIKVLEYNYQLLRNRQNSLQIEGLNPVEGMKALVGGTFDYFILHPEIVSLINTENMYFGKHVRQSDKISQMYHPLSERINSLLKKGSEEGVFQEGVDPVDLYITIAGLGWFYISCRHTLSTIFQHDLFDETRIRQRRDHIIEVVLGYLQPKDNVQLS